MGSERASITLVRRIEWIDTDAAGIYHWTVVFRFVEAAEAALHEELGIRERTFGRTPRVQVSGSFHRQLRFYDRVELVLTVESVGESSVRYGFTLSPVGEDEAAARGEIVIVHVSDSAEGGAVPWPSNIRERLLNGGDQGRVDWS